MPAYAYQGITPVVDPSSYVHPLASLIGDVIVGPGCFIAPGASLRGDFGRIVVEGDSSIQDNVSVHANQLRDTIIRRGATIAHGSIIHGCEIGENALIGMNAPEKALMQQQMLVNTKPEAPGKPGRRAAFGGHGAALASSSSHCRSSSASGRAGPRSSGVSR